MQINISINSQHEEYLNDDDLLEDDHISLVWIVSIIGVANEEHDETRAPQMKEF